MITQTPEQQELRTKWLAKAKEQADTADGLLTWLISAARRDGSGPINLSSEDRQTLYAAQDLLMGITLGDYDTP